jgi:hypothetical protein
MGFLCLLIAAFRVHPREKEVSDGLNREKALAPASSWPSQRNPSDAAFCQECVSEAPAHAKEPSEALRVDEFGFRLFRYRDGGPGNGSAKLHDVRLHYGAITHDRRTKIYAV